MPEAISLIKTASSWYCWATSLSCSCCRNTSTFPYEVVGIICPPMCYGKLRSWKVTEDVRGIVLACKIRLRSAVPVGRRRRRAGSRLPHPAADLIQVSDHILLTAQPHQLIKLSRLTLSLIQPGRLLRRDRLRLRN